jgi:predicted signal transduction protein with EAL and GGDEF domain
MIDLDGFKEVNDTQGHAAGDIVLKAAGDRLKERIGPLGTVAEGVEREDQRQRLRELGCESAQGYLFGRPMTGPRIMEIMNGAQHEGLARWPHFPARLADVADETVVNRA